MGKRFTATEKWDDPFFCELDAKYKLAWIYLLDKCDNAGIYDVNIKALSYFVGFDFNPEKLLSVFKGRVYKINGGTKWFIPKFIEFQYGVLTQDCYPHRPVIVKLEKYGLLENKGSFRVVTTLQEKEEEKDKEKDKEKEKEKEEMERKQKLEQAELDLKLVGDSIKKMIPEKHSLQLFIKEKCPNISKLPVQLSFDEATRLFNEFSRLDLQHIIEAMENYKPLASKNISVNLTIRNWLRRENKNGTNHKSSARGTIDFDKWERELKIARGEMPDMDAGPIQ